MTINDIISEQEEIELRKIANNTNALNALKKALLLNIYYNGTLVPGKDPNFSQNYVFSLIQDSQSGLEYKLNNEELGEKLRASIEGVRALQSGFNNIMKFKDKIDDKSPEINPAR